MPRVRTRSAGLVVVSALALTASACGADLPASVIKGSSVTIGWTHDLTSTNTASRSGWTPGNLDVAAMTHGRFARLVEGDVVVDKEFGTVKVTGDDPFTVRYDLAEHRWSDGIPVDAADLLLAWAAGSNALAGGGFASVPGDLAQSEEIPELDEFERRIDVVFSRPVLDWQTALDVAVPAHVVAMRALDVEDPMEAKQALITAIRDQDETRLGQLAKVWNDDFRLDRESGRPTADVLLANGPYRLHRIERGESGTERVRLVPNNEYAGKPPPTYETVDLVRSSPEGQLADLGTRLDIAQVAPTSANRQAVRNLERRDYEMHASHDGRMWVLVLRADRGVLRTHAARLAFLRALPRQEVKEAGAGPWSDEYDTTDALLFTPGARGYEIALEDSGFRTIVDKRLGKAGAERALAGVPAGAPVCVLYDRDEEFAVDAVAALRTGVAEAGWSIRDCGARDVAAAAWRLRSWHAVLMRVPVPQRPAEIAALWGSGKLSGIANTERDTLITALASAADTYAARALRVGIEKTLVKDAIALPLAMQPLLTVTDKDVEGVLPQAGPAASLTGNLVSWNPRRD